jgi:hypothetical protein
MAIFIFIIAKHPVLDGKPIEDPLSAKLNVQVMEVLEAARESARTGRQEELR